MFALFERLTCGCGYCVCYTKHILEVCANVLFDQTMWLGSTLFPVPLKITVRGPVKNGLLN